ncbi:MAG: hypothetical protein QXN93_04725 [Methanomassiliicoccales archaeon]
MTEKSYVENDLDWKKFIKEHWNIVAAFAAAGILAFVGAIYVFSWFIEEIQSTGLVPIALGSWTIGHVVAFILNLIFWESLLIGVPAIIGAALGWLWWKRLPVEEKKGYRFFKKRSRAMRGGSGASFVFFIALCIKVFIDGNWNVAIASWTLDYVAHSMITIVVWTAIIFGIPITIGLVLWLNHELKKNS